MEYYINFKTISLEKFAGKLRDSYLSPGRICLKENLDENFKIFKDMGCKNLDDLEKEIKSKKKIEIFALKTSLSINYLTILKREILSYKPKPVTLKQIPGIDVNILIKLHLVNIKNTMQLYNSALEENDRRALSEKTEISESIISELFKMSDLARINGVGPVFIRLLRESGISSVRQMSLTDAAKLLDQLIKVNQEKNYTRIMPSQKDIQFCIDFAGEMARWDETCNQRN